MNPQTNIYGIMQNIITKNVNQFDPLKNSLPSKKKQEKLVRLKKRE
jgi:hypothetical protein